MNRNLKLDYAFRIFQTAFDPDQFNQMPVNDANETVFIPIDEGEYPGIISKKEFRVLDKTGQLVMDVTWKIDDAEQQQKTGRENLIARQSVFIDRTESGSLDMGTGKNIQLGRLREAVGLNVPGQPFQFAMLEGKAAMCKIKNRKVDDDVYSEVKTVTAL